KDGFYVSDGANFKLVLNGFIQARYNYVMHHLPSSNATPAGSGFAGNRQQEANGFDIRRARMSMSGYVFSPNIIFKLEGDFFTGTQVGSIKTGTVNGAGAGTTPIQTITSGNFGITDAYVGYNFNDQLKVKAGSFKVPFTKAELISDTNLGLMERPEVNTPF